MACAKALGRDGKGARPEEITRVLGSWDTLGAFAIAGPFFRSETDGDLLPIPAHVMLQDGDAGPHLVRLAPSGQPMTTDLGSICLPVPPDGDDEPLVSLAGRCGKVDAVMRLLAGQDVSPDDLGGPQPGPGSGAPSLLCNPAQALPGWGPDDLGKSEPRVGIERNKTSAKAEDGMLYASVHRALLRDIEMFVESTGSEGPFDGEMAVQLGGEARFAFVRKDETAPALPESPPAPQGNHLIYLATPALMPPPVVGEPLAAGMPGTLVSAVLPSVSAHNDRAGGKKGAARTVLPAGTVLFGEGSGTETMPGRIGADTHLGYGRYTIGEWT